MSIKTQVILHHPESGDYQTDNIRTLIVRASRRLNMYLYVQNRNAALTRNGFSIHNFEEKFNIPLYIIPVLEFSIYGSTLSETKNEHLT